MDRTRGWCIAHLCIAFSLLCWYGGHPFLHDLFDVRWQLKALEQVEPHLAELPEEQRETVLTLASSLNAQLEEPFFEKCRRAMKLLLLDLPPFMRMWLFLSILLPILLLLKYEGARPALWLLPIAATVLALNAKSPPAPFLPSETALLEHYGNPQDTSWDSLKTAWENYLAKEWYGETWRLGLAKVQWERTHPGPKPGESGPLAWSLLFWSLLLSASQSRPKRDMIVDCKGVHP